MKKSSKCKWKKLSVLLCAALACNLMPTVSFAAEDEVENDTEITIQLQAQPEAATVDMGLDNDELFEGYVNELFYGNPEGEVTDDAEPKLQTSSLRRSALSSNSQVIYDAICAKAKKLAAGEENEAVVTISAAELSGREWYAASDLGVSQLVKDGTLTEDASDAYLAKLKIDMSLILSAMLTDEPYLFYWFDKTIGYIWLSDGWQSRTDNTLCWSDDGTMTLYLAVSEDYVPEGAAVDSMTGYYLYTDTAKTSAAAAAASNAKTIITDNQSASDYEKISSYKKSICDLVSYNDAAAGNAATPYGDPWQLIWVFDGDDSTNVVCEGYSKAFQYLCDQSTWDDSRTDCITVTGTMNGGTGAGGHMWNLVNLEGGTYIADITNSDTGTAGQGGALFLTGNNGGKATGYTFKIGTQNIAYEYDEDTIALYSDSERTLSVEDYTYVPHEHELMAHSAVAATCTEAGNSAYWSCAGCGKYFSDEAGEHVITKDSWVIPATGHEWGDVTYSWTDDNHRCTATRICKNNSSHAETETVNALSEVMKEPTCENTGEMTWTATFTNPNFATQQKQDEVAATGHDYALSKWEWSKDYSSATATFTCKNDKSHVLIVTTSDIQSVTTDATSETNGSIKYTASVLGPDGETYSDSKSVTVAATGYHYREPVYIRNGDCVTATLQCIEDESRNIVETVTATFSVIEPATCEQEGSGVYNAYFENTNIPDWNEEVIIHPSGHDYALSKWEWSKDYTEATARFVCANDADHTESVHAIISSKRQDSTYEADGSVTYTATVSFDGVTYTDTREVTIPKLPLQTQTLSGTASYIRPASAGVFSLGMKSNASGAKLTYTSSNPKVAAVNAAGQVTPVAAGTATITVTAAKTGYQAASKVITVQVTGLTVGKSGTYGSGAAKATYKVTGADTVTFVKSKQSAKKATAITVPATVTIKGAAYKVTAVGANAAKGFKKAKKVTIGKNVKTIGDNAFANNTVLKTMTISSTVLTSLGKNFVKGDKKLTKITIKSKKLTAKKCKKCLTGSFVKTVSVPKASRKSYARKIFTRKVCGRKVTVK